MRKMSRRSTEKSKKVWEEQIVGTAIKRTPESTQKFTTGSGEFEVKRLYTPLDVSEFHYLEQIGFPGQYPFTRGIDPLGLRAREWPRYFYSGYGSPEEANQRYKDLIRVGANHISLALDLPTQLGYDSDHDLAVGEVGRVGVALSTLDDLERLFEGIPLENITLATVGNCIGPWMLSMFYVLLERKGLQPSKMKVILQNDPFKEYTGRGTYIFPVRTAVDLAADTVEFSCRHLPRWEPQYACSTTMRWGGCSASQEVAFGIANLVAYVGASRKKGVAPESLVPRMNLHMTADDDLFEEVAKFRATRRLWAKISRQAFGTENPDVLALRLTVYTNSTRLTTRQPLNNIVRTTMHVLAAILGGAERISAPAFDEALALPTFESTWQANLTKHILTDENRLGVTVDPMGGAYYLETLTDQIEKEALKCFGQIEAMGGAIAAVESGYYLREMANGIYKRQQEIENGQRIVIGVNRLKLEQESEIKTFHFNPEVEEKKIQSLRSIKSRRSNGEVTRCLVQIKEAAEKKFSGENVSIVPSMIEAVKAYATVGEIFGVLRDVFGEFKLQKIF